MPNAVKTGRRAEGLLFATQGLLPKFTAGIGAFLAGALVSGLGCALVFPALGVEALKRTPPANRGSTTGAFVAFLDIAYGISGPVAGLIAGQFNYAAVYLFGAACALAGAALVITTPRPQS